MTYQALNWPDFTTLKFSGIVFLWFSVFQRASAKEFGPSIVVIWSEKLAEIEKSPFHLVWNTYIGTFVTAIFLFWKIQKTLFLNNKHMIKWVQNLLNINIFTRALHLSHPQTQTGKKWNFSFFSEINLFWIDSTRMPQNGQKWPPKTPEMVLIC